MTAVTHQTVAIEGTDGPLRVHLAEAGTGPPLLLLHGWPQHSGVWDRVVPLLADDFRLLMPDLRGFGSSGITAGGYNPVQFAADAIALLDALGIERAGVIGHDWGGFAAYLLGMRHPERARRAHSGRRLSVPTRAVFGADDFYIAVSNTLGGEEHADDWSLRLLEGCGHWTPEERPEAVEQAARELF